MNIYLGKDSDNNFYLSLNKHFISLDNQDVLKEVIELAHKENPKDEEIYIITNISDEAYLRKKEIIETIDDITELPLLEMREPVEVYEFEELDELSKCIAYFDNEGVG